MSLHMCKSLQNILWHVCVHSHAYKFNFTHEEYEVPVHALGWR